MAAPTILTVEEILDAAKLGTSYAIKDREVKKAYDNSIENLQPEKISFVYKRVQNRFDKDPTDTTLRATANLLWDLLGIYGLRAINNINPSGGTVIQASQNGQLITIAYRYIQFIVGDSSSVQPAGYPTMNDGDVLYVIPFPTVVDAESIFRQSVSVPRAPIADSNYTITYGTSTTQILFSVPVTASELIQMHLWQLLTPASGGAGAEFLVITITTTGDTVDVPELAGKEFALAATGTQSFTPDYVIQTGITLDFSLVGGVTAGQVITIFYS